MAKKINVLTAMAKCTMEVIVLDTMQITAL